MATYEYELHEVLTREEYLDLNCKNIEMVHQ